MAAFPSLEPQGRTYGLGKITTIVSDIIVNKVGNFRAGHTVSLAFTYRRESDCHLVLSHYAAHQTSIEFTTPATIWKMQIDQYEIAPGRFQWRWNKPPTFTPLGAGLFDIAVELVSSLM
jgi:hypothetical protein